PIFLPAFAFLLPLPLNFLRNSFLFTTMANNLLSGKKGIIFGALDERSIAWKVALRAVEEGAQIVLSNAPVALRMGTIKDLSAQCNNAPVIGADATSISDLENLYQQSMDHFGGKADF